MENASKALIIAGSILLSILIIALGMFIFSNSSSTTDGLKTSLSENEKQTFNIKFEKYVGTQTGSNVSALISAVRSNASANRQVAEKIPDVIFDDSGVTSGTHTAHAEGGNELTTSSGTTTGTLTTYMTELSNITNALENSHEYDVVLGYNEAGLVSEITITY